MNFGSILILAVGLAMDAAAVALALGLAARRVGPRDVAWVAGLFGGFQALMPWLGSVLGALAGPWLNTWNRWIACLVLTGLGARMLLGAVRSGDAETRAAERESSFELMTLLGLAVATSLDAFFAGVTLPLLGAPLLPTVTWIGLVTAGLSAGTLLAGQRLGKALGPRLEILGGVLLILLGIKFLLGS